MSLKVKFVLFSLFTFIVLIVISNATKFGVKVEPALLFTFLFFALGAGCIFIWKILPVQALDVRLILW